MSNRSLLVPCALLALAGCHHGACVAPAHAASSVPAEAPAASRAPATPPAVSGTAPALRGSASMLDALFTAGRVTRPLSELAQSAQLAPDEAFRIVELGRDSSSSHHLVLLRDAEPVHRHDHHDLLVLVLRGSGQMLIGNEERAVGEHSLIYVPRGTPHAMRNTSGQPSAAYAVFMPPFDGQDRVLVEPAQPPSQAAEQK